MQNVLYMAGAILVGMMISSQPALNAMLSRAVGGPYAATVISIFVALVFGLVFLAIAGGANYTRAALASVPWWVYLGGVVGAVFVASGPVIAPVIGALLFFVCIVAGQLIGAAIADHFGAFGLEVRKISLQRAIGLALVLVGAVLVNRG